MDAKQYKIVESLLRPKIKHYRNKYRLAVEVDDLLQETLLKALKRPLNDIEEHEWAVMAESVAIDLYRKQQCAQKAEAAYVSHLGEGSSGPSLEDLQETATAEQKEIVAGLLAGNTISEVAAGMKCSEKTVTRSIKQLRTSWQK